MKLRKLREEDAQFMLEWMHDKDVVGHLAADFSEKKIEDCIDFIRKSQTDSTNLHFAIVDDSDKYLGTVSLKHIDENLCIAEFAITVRKVVMGTGIAAEAMTEVLLIGLKKYKMKRIYWCVNEDNARAVRFYDKNGYTRTKQVPQIILDNYDVVYRHKLIWYEYGS